MVSQAGPQELILLPQRCMISRSSHVQTKQTLAGSLNLSPAGSNHDAGLVVFEAWFQLLSVLQGANID